MRVTGVSRVLALPALAALALTLLPLVGPARQAAADDCGFGETSGNDLEYCNEIPGEDGGGGGGGDSDSDSTGGGSEPQCDLASFRAQWPGATRHFCEGRNACWVNDPPVTFEDPSTWPDDRPSPDARYIYKYCVDPNGNVVFDDFTWSTDEQGPSPQELARRAYGRLKAPEFDLAFSPPGESVVYVETWWWAQGAPEGEIRGSSALGMVAIAEPDHMEVRPGDGSGTITCDIVVTESDACTHTYERASGEGGYPAQARLVYDVRFEMNGNPMEIDGAPDTFESDWQETNVPVTEVQANVVR